MRKPCCVNHAILSALSKPSPCSCAACSYSLGSLSRHFVVFAPISPFFHFPNPVSVPGGKQFFVCSFSNRTLAQFSLKMYFIMSTLYFFPKLTYQLPFFERESPPYSCLFGCSYTTRIFRPIRLSCIYYDSSFEAPLAFSCKASLRSGCSLCGDSRWCVQILK